MPVNSTFMSETRYLSPTEIFEVVSELCDYGLEEVRLTGGEPLMRRELSEIIELIGSLPLKKIGITTNGVMLLKHLEHFKINRVQYLNISLDSLHVERFQKITHGNQLNRVLESIQRAKEMGFSIKLNMVVMKGVNDSEILDFIEFSKLHQIEVRFLELMRIGYACESQTDQFISAQEMLQTIKSKYTLVSQSTTNDSTSFNFATLCGANFGFIASESQAFCGQCSRWRLSADGIMRACLFKDDGLVIRHKSALEREAIYHQLLEMKPKLRPAAVNHQMNTIGG